MATVEYIVPDISCEGCANAIKRAVSTLDGIKDVGVDVASRRVSVKYDDEVTGPEEIMVRIEDAGYTPEPTGP
jgi:copper chaperone CopZ